MTTYNPFNSIGLCFSGGGYRAAAFSLGILSYLDRVEINSKSLLSNVNALSTVSGGTITGVFYAHSLSKNYKFKQFYDELYDFLKNDSLLYTATGYLENNKKWKTIRKKRSLINAFALAYEQLLFKGKIDQFFKTEFTKKLRFVCFNATEFAFGLVFRFQNKYAYGNNALKSAALNKVWHKIKLSDVVASSSCFPFGFEPMIFPDDYFESHSNEDYQNLKYSKNFKKGIGIMDGGIVDNQGIGSMIRMDDSLTKSGSPLDLLIINDVCSYKMNPWQPGERNVQKSHSLKVTVKRFIGFFKVKRLYILTFLVGFLMLTLNEMGFAFGKSWISLYIIGGAITAIGLLLTIVGIFAKILKKNVIRFAKKISKENIPDELKDDVSVFYGLEVSLIKRMIEERLTSAFSMISEVFLKQIRRINYDYIHDKDKYKDKIITSTVYKLNGQPNHYSNFKFNPLIKPALSSKIKDSALIASEMGTTLWWNKDDHDRNRFHHLIACGQYTTCYNLLDFISKLPKPLSAEVIKMQSKLKKDWKNFSDTPLGLVEKEKK